MYTAELKSKQIVPARDGNRKILEAVVDFKKGQKVVSHTFTFALYTTVEQITRIIKEFAAEIEAGETLEANLSEGSVDFAVAQEPSQDQLDFQAWMKKVGKLERVQRLVDLGVFTGTEQQIVDLQNTIKTEFKVAYLTLM